MKKLFPLLIAVGFISWACEDDEDAASSCTDLLMAQVTSLETYTAEGGNTKENCDAYAADFVAWYDGGCDESGTYTDEVVEPYRDGTYCESLFP